MKKPFSTSIQGKIKNTNVPKEQPLLPLLEAIVNSFQAIDEKRETDKSYVGEIIISPIYSSQTTMQENIPIDGFTVRDNGIGFTPENMASFLQSDSIKKTAIGGKGIGRFSWLKVFSCADIKSVYHDGKFMFREFSFLPTEYEIDDDSREIDANSTYTEVTLKNINSDYERSMPDDLTVIGNQVMQHCLLFFLAADCPNVIIKDGDFEISLNEQFEKNVEPTIHKATFVVEKETFELQSMHIKDKSFGDNQIFLCANDRAVEKATIKLSSKNYVNNLDKTIFDNEGYYYLGVLKGDYLDKTVNTDRTNFNMVIDDSESPFIYSITKSAIIKKACEEISTFLNEYLKKTGEEKSKKIDDFVKNNPQYKLLTEYMTEDLTAISPAVANNDEKLEDELHRIKRNFDKNLAKQNNDMKSSLSKGDTNTEEYNEKFNDYLGKITASNASSLAEYMAHRKVIIDLLEIAIGRKDDGRFTQEGIIHKLIYPMRKSSDDIEFMGHNLWLINESMAYSSFISSDKPFNDKREERTDILIADNPVAVTETKPDTGEAYNTIIIYEIKKPQRDDFDGKSNPIDQLLDYAQKIRNKEVKNMSGRPLLVTDNTKYYLYAICDTTPSLEKVLISKDYTKTTDGLGYYGYNKTINAYIEVLPFEKMIKEANKRHKAFFERLGLNS